MKKIYTLFKSKTLHLSLLSAFITTMAFSQPICGPVVENFNNTGGSTAGFIGDFTIGSNGGNGYLEKRKVIASGIYTITTPTYQLANNATFIGFGFLLDGSEKVARAEVAIMYYSTLNNELTTVFLTQFVPTYDLSATPPTADVCRVVATSELPGFPTGGKYRLRIELTPNTGNGQTTNYITFDDFRTNGTLAQSPLPVSFIGFDAKRAANGISLVWKVGGEENVNHYEVERSLDGRNFLSIANITTIKKDTYTYLDPENNSLVYYRIKNVDNDGKFKYSSINRISNGKASIVIKAFPQPVTSQLTVQHPSVKGNGMLVLTTADGRVVHSVKPSSGSLQTNIDMANMQKGMYFVRFDDGEGNTETMKILKQ